MMEESVCVREREGREIGEDTETDRERKIMQKSICKLFF